MVPPPLQLATISKSGKVKVTRKGRKILVDTGIKVSCPTACTAAASGKNFAKKTFRIAAGKTQKIVLTHEQGRQLAQAQEEAQGQDHRRRDGQDRDAHHHDQAAQEVGSAAVPNRRPRIEIVQTAASPEEAAAVAAAIEQFLRATAPPPAPAEEPMNAWVRAALLKGWTGSPPRAGSNPPKAGRD